MSLFQYFREYGIRLLIITAFSRVLRRLGFNQKTLDRYDNYKHKKVIEYLGNNYFEDGSNSDWMKVSSQCENDTIWVYWWQGENDAPDVVKCCINSLKQNSRKRVVFLSKTNLREYCDLPEWLYQKFEAGKIGMAHFSDIIRFYLLYKYGGYWADSTCFCAKEFPEGIEQLQFYSLTNFFEKTLKWKWTSFFMYGRQGNLISKKMIDFYLRYWKDHDCAITYLFLDCFMEVNYINDIQFRNLIDEIPKHDCPMPIVQTLNDECNDTKYREIMSRSFFINKLSYKVNNVTMKNGKKTLYGMICDKYLKIKT